MTEQSITISAGVDLAAAPANTALAVVEWSGGSASLTGLTVDVGDDAIVDLVGASSRAGGKTAIDCPLGWPERFVEFLLAHRDGTAPTDLGTPDARRPLLYRRTDLAVIAAGYTSTTGPAPLRSIGRPGSCRRARMPATRTAGWAMRSAATDSGRSPAAMTARSVRR